MHSQKDKVAIIGEIQKALDGMVFGSVELYVQNRKVTQITVRHIKKTSVETKEPKGFNVRDDVSVSSDKVGVKIGIDKQ